MGHTAKTEKHPEEQLWHELKHVRAGMLGLEGSHRHLQPMAHMLDRDNDRLWFFTSKDTDLATEMGDGAHAHFCVMGKDQDYQACLMGFLQPNNDRARIDEYWNDMAAAWWSSKDAPDLLLLEYVLMDAAIWASTKTRSASPGRCSARSIPRRSPTSARGRMWTSWRTATSASRATNVSSSAFSDSKIFEPSPDCRHSWL